MSRGTTGRAAVVGIVALLVAFPVAGHYRAKGRASNYRRALEQKGEKMTLAGVRPLLNPDAVSAGQGLMAAVDRFGNIEEPISNLPPATKVTAPGRAVVRWNQDPLPSYESTNVWPLLTKLLDDRREEMAGIRYAACGPSPALDLDYSLMWQLPMPHLSRIRRAGELLSASALLDLHSGQMSNALASLQALCALSGPGDEPVLWAEKARSRIGETALITTWEALQRPGWNEHQLRVLQGVWQSVDWLTQAERALAMERLWNEQIFVTARQSYPLGCPVCSKKGVAEVTELCGRVLKEPLEGMQGLVQRYPKYWAWEWWVSYDEEIATLKTVQAGIEAVRVLRRDKVFGPVLRGFETNVTATRREHPGSERGIGLMMNSYYSVQKFMAEIQAAEVRRSLCVTAIALAQWRLQHHSYPAGLAELVPEFVPESPVDIVDGAPLRYRLNEDGSFLLYSVGENGVDDGGAPAFPSQIGLGINPTHWWRGRDAVWPRPATQNEAAAYFETIRLEAIKTLKRQANETGVMEAFRKRYGLR